MAVEIRFIFDDNGKICPAKKIKWSKNKERKQDKAATKEKTNTTTKDKNEYYINSISLDYQEHHWQVE